jgi:hypothetical protein
VQDIPIGAALESSVAIDSAGVIREYRLAA